MKFQTVAEKAADGWCHPREREFPENRERWREFAVRRRYYERAPGWQQDETPDWYLDWREAEGGDVRWLRVRALMARWAAEHVESAVPTGALPGLWDEFRADLMARYGEVSEPEDVFGIPMGTEASVARAKARLGAGGVATGTKTPETGTREPSVGTSGVETGTAEASVGTTAFAARLAELGWTIQDACLKLGKSKRDIVRWKREGAPADVMARLA